MMRETLHVLLPFVVGGLVGLAVWLFLHIRYRLTHWWVDPSEGSDENRGDLPFRPVKTLGEVRRRIGKGPIVRGTVVHVMSDAPLHDPVDFSFEIGSRGFFIIVGKSRG